MFIFRQCIQGDIGKFKLGGGVDFLGAKGNTPAAVKLNEKTDQLRKIINYWRSPPFSSPAESSRKAWRGV
jgi:hypothetical protein